jgi:uncharacterized protein YndB with AHSA1/START domain
MKATEEGAPVLVVRRRMAVPRERVFRAWLDSDSLAHWMLPTGITRATVTVDPRVGGGFRILMDGPTHGVVEHTGEYLAIEPPSRLSFTWISRHTDHRPTVVTIEFHERGDGTELVLTHRGLPPQEVEGHRRGWTDIVRLLEDALHPAA